MDVKNGESAHARVPIPRIASRQMVVFAGLDIDRFNGRCGGSASEILVENQAIVASIGENGIRGTDVEATSFPLLCSGLAHRLSKMIPPSVSQSVFP
jgi:hypothetical protein